MKRASARAARSISRYVHRSCVHSGRVGELTSRFVAKAVTVIVISGGVWYYVGSLKKTPEAAHAIK
jgi:hypothetical protein